MRDKLSPALFEHFAQLFRESAPPYLTLSIQALAKKRNFSLPAPTYSNDNVSYVCFPYYSPVGYLTLYVVKRTRLHKNDDPIYELTLLQHADVYDDETRATTRHLRACFPNATLQRVTLPKEQASDFALLATYAVAPSSPTFSVSTDLLAQLRKTAVTYTELLEHSAATARNENLRDLLEDHADLQHAKSACFSPAFHACTSTRDTTELPPPLAAPAAAPEQPQPTRTKTASPTDPLICDDPQRNTFQGNEVIFGGHIECDAAPSSGLNPYSRKAAACASSVAAPAAPPPSMERPKKTYYCQICDKEMPQFNERCHSCKRSGCTDCITYPGPTHVKPSCVLCDKDDGASQESAWEELLLARTCRRIYNEPIS